MDVFGNREDRDVLGNSSQDAWGNASNADVWGDPPQDAHGNYFTPGAFASDVPEGATDGPGLIDALGEAISNFFGLFGG